MWEVVYPTSRAVELGADDDEEEKCVFQSHSSAPIVRMSNELGKTVSCKLLVMAFEKIPTKFIEAHFVNSESQIAGMVSSGYIKEGCVNSLRQTASSDKTCFIHSSLGSKDILFCQCKVGVSAEACHNWANEVLSCIKAEKVLILSSLPASVCSLNCDTDVDSNHMFVLKTDNWKSNINCPLLQSPNIASNLPAAVLSHCQIFNIPAVMYIAVLAADSLADSTVVEIFNTLLDHDLLKDIPRRPRLETTKFLKSVKISCPHLDSNMYI